MQAARANVQRLKELSGFEKIVAPFDGIVTARNTDIGQLIAAGENTGPALFRVADMHRLRTYVTVPQTYAASMKPGLKADLVFPDRPGKVYTATLDSTSNAIDTSTRTLLAQLVIDNKNGELLPGAYAEVHFHLPPGAAGPVIQGAGERVAVPQRRFARRHGRRQQPRRVEAGGGGSRLRLRHRDHSRPECG